MTSSWDLFAARSDSPCDLRSAGHRPLSPSDLSWIVCSVAAAFHGVSVFAGKVIAQSLGANVVRIRPGVVACGPPRPAATIVGSPKVRIEFDGLGVVRNRAVKVTFGALRLAATRVSRRIIRLEFDSLGVVRNRAVKVAF